MSADRPQRGLRLVGWGRIPLPWTRRRLQEAEDFAQELIAEAIARNAQAEDSQQEGSADSDRWRPGEDLAKGSRTTEEAGSDAGSAGPRRGPITPHFVSSPFRASPLELEASPLWKVRVRPDESGERLERAPAFPVIVHPTPESEDDAEDDRLDLALRLLNELRVRPRPELGIHHVYISHEPKDASETGPDTPDP